MRNTLYLAAAMACRAPKRRARPFNVSDSLQ